MKRTLSLILSIIMLVSVVSSLNIVVLASTVASGSCGDNATWVYDSDGTLTISGTGELYSLYSTPWTDEGYNKSITKVVIEEGITKIGFREFWYCPNLTVIYLPSTIVLIKETAFDESDNITQVYYNGTAEDWNNIKVDTSSARAYVSETENSAYMKNMDYSILSSCDIYDLNGSPIYTDFNHEHTYDCEVDFTAATISYTCKLCGESGVANLGSIGSLPVGTTFSDDDLIYKVTAENKVAVMGTVNSNAKSLTIPNSVQKYTKRGYSVTRIANKAFYGCTKLTSIELGKYVSSIGEKAFARCTSLKTVSNGDGVKKIEKYAFYNCTSLESLDKFINVTSIGSKAFTRCKSLVQLGKTKNVVKLSKINSMGSYAFYDCSSIQKVDISTKLETIPTKAFVRCKSLTSVTGCKGLTEIGNYAFYNCTKLASINNATKITTIGDKAFAYCSKLVRIGSTKSTITLPSVTSIGAYAFYNCSGMTTVKATSTALTTIGQAAFKGCTSLKTFSESSKKLNSIGKQTFYGDSKLATITLKSTKLTTKNVGSKAFKGIKSTATFKIPAGKGTAYKKIFKAAGASSKITVKKA